MYLGEPRPDCLFHYLSLSALDPVPCHRPPGQNCYAASWTSSWSIPVRGVHRGKGAQYFALYSGHMGVPVQRKQVSHTTLRITSSCIYWKRWSYQIACHMLGRYQIELAFAKPLTHRCIHQGFPLVFAPNAVLTDRRQYTQAAGTRSKVSNCCDCFREREL